MLEKCQKIIINQEKSIKMKCMGFFHTRFIRMGKCKQSKNKSIYYSHWIKPMCFFFPPPFPFCWGFHGWILEVRDLVPWRNELPSKNILFIETKCYEGGSRIIFILFFAYLYIKGALISFKLEGKSVILKHLLKE